MVSYKEARAQYRADREQQKNDARVPQFEAGTHTANITNLFFNQQDERKNDHPTLSLTVTKVDENGKVICQTKNNFDITDELGYLNRDVADMIDRAIGDAAVDELCAMSDIKDDRYLKEGDCGFTDIEAAYANHLMDLASGINRAFKMGGVSATPLIDVLITPGTTLDRDGNTRNNISIWGFRGSDGLRPAGTFEKKRAATKAVREYYHQKDILRESNRGSVMQRL